MESGVKKVNRFSEVIDLHKKKGIDTYTLKTESGEVCVLREPTVKETGNLIPLIIGFGDNKPDLVQAGIDLVETCWLAGDDKIRKDEDLKAEVGLGAINMIDIKVAEVKKN